ncbi:MAG: hypothetical protein ACRD72_21440 [Candidatus Angelobacter sp.]
MNGALTVEASVQTPAQRCNAAVERAQQALPDAGNAKLLQAILLEEAARKVAEDHAFADVVMSRYQQSAPMRVKGGRQSRPLPRASDIAEPLVAVNPIPDYEIQLRAAPDPYFILQVFGSHQLAKALNQRSLPDVRKAAKMVEERNPGKHPAARTKAGLIAFIMDTLVR